MIAGANLEGVDSFLLHSRVTICKLSAISILSSPYPRYYISTSIQMSSYRYATSEMST